MMLEAAHITCGYGAEPVVRDLSLTLHEGERLAILGPNGCGKTTLLRALAGLLPYEGTVTIRGEDAARLSRRELSRRVALMSQSAQAGFSYTVYETVAMGRYAWRRGGLLDRDGPDDTAAVRESLERTGLWPLRDRFVTELSGGQLQRVFLARTFAQDPAIILLDEPTSHLDLKYQVELIGSVKEWTARPGRAAIGVFHDLNLALDFADTALLMAEGKAVSAGPAETADPALLSRIYGMDVPRYMKTALGRWA